MTWQEIVSQIRELAKETEDFTTRLQVLASQIQRKMRDEESAKVTPIEPKPDTDWTGN